MGFLLGCERPRSVSQAAGRIGEHQWRGPTFRHAEGAGTVFRRLRGCGYWHAVGFSAVKTDDGAVLAADA